MSADWKSGLFGCMDEPFICLQTLCCPCVTYGQIAELGPAGVPCQGNCFGAACLYICCAECAVCIVCEARKHIRTASGIEGTCCEDFCTVCCCGPCVLCQVIVSAMHVYLCVKLPRQAVRANARVVALRQSSQQEGEPASEAVLGEQGYLSNLLHPL